MRGVLGPVGIREGGLLLTLATLIVVFSVVSPFFRNVASALDQSRFWLEIGIMAAGMMPVIVARGIDLSIASILALSGATIVRLHAEMGMGIWWAAEIGLVVGTTAGILNGLIIVLLRIPDLVATLATMVIYRGLTMVVIENRVYSNLPDSYREVGGGTVLGIIPVGWVILAAVWIAALVILHHLRAGRFVFATGSNPTAARFAGVPVDSVRILVYALSGLSASIAAIVYTARNNTAKSDDAMGFELDVIACVVLGGVPITGGRGTVAGMALGVLIIGTLRTGLQLAAVGDIYVRIAIGAILVATAGLNEWLARRGT